MFKSPIKIFVTGHKGMVGSSVLRKLKFYKNAKVYTAGRGVLDLRDQKKVELFFKKNKFDAVINCAAMVGGIHYNNKNSGDFILNNLLIQNNIINSSFKNKIRNLIFLGSNCIYPKKCKQPIKEEYLLSGTLEKTNEAYAVAKIAGVKLCENLNYQYGLNYKCIMPPNLYGPGDNYDLDNSHFFPALIKKIYLAKLNNKNFIKIWGSGKPMRELMHVDDVASACIFFLKKKTKHTIINVGNGKERSINGYAKFICKKLKANLKFKYDKSKPDGTPRKINDIKIALSYGWKPKISLDEGFDCTFSDFLKRK